MRWKNGRNWQLMKDFSLVLSLFSASEGCLALEALAFVGFCLGITDQDFLLLMLRLDDC
jgi:hypothetical protein